MNEPSFRPKPPEVEIIDEDGLHEMLRLAVLEADMLREMIRRQDLPLRKTWTVIVTGLYVRNGVPCAINLCVPDFETREEGQRVCQVMLEAILDPQAWMGVATYTVDNLRGVVV